MAALGTDRLAIATQGALIIPTPHYPRRPGLFIIVYRASSIGVRGRTWGCSCQGDEIQKVLDSNSRHGRSGFAIRPSWRSCPVVLLVLCGFVLCGTIAIATAAVLSSLYDRILADKERERRTFASVVAGQLDQMLQSVSLVETGLIEKIRANGVASVGDFEKQLSSHDVYLMLRTGSRDCRKRRHSR